MSQDSEDQPLPCNGSSHPRMKPSATEEQPLGFSQSSALRSGQVVRNNKGSSESTPRTKARFWRLSFLCSAFKSISFWASLLNLLGSVGYIAADFARGYIGEHAAFSDALYIVLGFSFLIDAVLYLLSWYPAWPERLYPDFAAEAINILGSCIYASTSIMYLKEYNPNEKFVLIDAVIILEYIAAVLFLFDSLLYGVPWFREAWQSFVEQRKLVIERKKENKEREEVPLPTATSSSSQIEKSGSNRGMHQQRAITAAPQKKDMETCMGGGHTSNGLVAIIMASICSIGFWENALNVLPSLLYVTGGTLGVFVQFFEEKELGKFVVNQNISCPQAANLEHFTAFLRSQKIYYKDVRVPERSLFCRGGELHIDLLRLDHKDMKTLGITNPKVGFARALRLASQVYVVGDVLWFLDALISMFCWFRSVRNLFKDKKVKEGSIASEEA